MPEQTLIIIKPDGLQRRLAGEIVGRFERKGFRIAAARLMRISSELAQKHYEIHRGKDFFDRAVKYISSAPVVVIVIEGEKAVESCRKMMGATFGYDALPGTIRGDFSSSQQHNLIHGSDSAESAQREISLYFTPDEILDYEMMDSAWL